MTLDKRKYWKKVSLLENFFRSKLKYHRDKIYEIILKKIEFNGKKILDVGSTPDLDDHHNTLIHKIKTNKEITCLSNFDCSILKKLNSNIEIIKGDGLNTNLKDNTFDIVHSSATIEHVGSEYNQNQFIKECIRISKKTVIITTPNRFFPIDFHTKIPFIHFLPKKIHRKLLVLTNNHFFSKEENLNLLSINDLRKYLNKCNIRNFEIFEYKIFFMTSNLILIINKN